MLPHIVSRWPADLWKFRGCWKLYRLTFAYYLIFYIWNRVYIIQTNLLHINSSSCGRCESKKRMGRKKRVLLMISPLYSILNWQSRYSLSVCWMGSHFTSPLWKLQSSAFAAPGYWYWSGEVVWTNMLSASIFHDGYMIIWRIIWVAIFLCIKLNDNTWSIPWYPNPPPLAPREVEIGCSTKAIPSAPHWSRHPKLIWKYISKEPEGQFCLHTKHCPPVHWDLWSTDNNHFLDTRHPYWEWTFVSCTLATVRDGKRSRSCTAQLVRYLYWIISGWKQLKQTVSLRIILLLSL